MNQRTDVSSISQARRRAARGSVLWQYFLTQPGLCARNVTDALNRTKGRMPRVICYQRRNL